MKKSFILVFFFICSTVLAATEGGFQQRLGARLPLNAQFENEHGQHHRLGDYFSGKPVLVVLGYYHCPRLCSTVMDGILQGVQNVNLPYTIVGIGIDPSETPGAAARKHASYIAANDLAHPDRLHLLVGGQQAIASVARQIGFNYSFDQDSGLYTHPAGFVIATPDGHVSRYFSGLRFSPRDVRLALIEASSNRIGTWSEQIVLLCSHYDPVTGRYSVAVMQLVRAAGILVLLSLIVCIGYFHRRARSRP